MGLGLLGRGVGDAKFLAESGAELIVTDLKSSEDLAPSLKKLSPKNYHLKAVTYVLGRHRLEDFRHRDLIIKAAGVSLDSPFIAEARRNKIPIMMSTALFAKLSGTKIIGVTGTRGKTTVTHLIYEILKHHCQCQGFPLTLWLGGNIKGISTLALLPKVRPKDWVVLELDSWQLQGFGALKISPQISVFTNFLPDHLNYYRGSMKKYFADKANIFKYQKKDDAVFAGREVARKIKSPGRKIVPPALPSNWRLNLAGEHNRVNASLAVGVARELGVPDRVIKKVLADFASVPGRLELIHTINGVKFYNDTTATSPDAMMAALQSLGPPGKIILIAGGTDKNFPNDSLIKFASSSLKLKQVILLPGTGTDKLMKSVSSTDGLKTNEATNWQAVNTLAEAVNFASRLAKRGDSVLLSPGFASFGLFKNEFDRGDKFNRLVKKIK